MNIEYLPRISIESNLKESQKIFPMKEMLNVALNLLFNFEIVNPNSLSHSFYGKLIKMNLNPLSVDIKEDMNNDYSQIRFYFDKKDERILSIHISDKTSLEKLLEGFSYSFASFSPTRFSAPIYLGR